MLQPSIYQSIKQCSNLLIINQSSSAPTFYLSNNQAVLQPSFYQSIKQCSNLLFINQSSSAPTFYLSNNQAVLQPSFYQSIKQCSNLLFINQSSSAPTCRLCFSRSVLQLLDSLCREGEEGGADFLDSLTGLSVFSGLEPFFLLSLESLCKAGEGEE
ncbi:hypothetical protein DPMN_125099 [Dreissena polymorpha]|uniref:Uncharacterized protein n=1 Tax=Dreissena polymorpha TaxID=45954 RepID=A0A9D4GUI4_DREPO|nr:hypothetical protein DPMN_125099 [Dreissena polymorpha]